MAPAPLRTQRLRVRVHVFPAYCQQSRLLSAKLNADAWYLGSRAHRWFGFRDNDYTIYHSLMSSQYDIQTLEHLLSTE